MELTRPASLAIPNLAGTAGRLADARFLVLLLIIAGAATRLSFGAMLGLGIDESYMVAAGRKLQLGYFDHPPVAWWLCWAAAKIAGSDAAIVVRLPFIGLFAVSTWLMFRLGSVLYNPEAGLWAAVGLNLSPVFSLTTGSWVLPDGPLDCALLGAAFCLARALPASPGRAWRWWLGAGLCAGIALLSKYTAVLTCAGVILFLITQPEYRRWLGRPEPYVAAAIVALAAGYILAWNASHDWASLAFQAGRGTGHRFRPFAPFAVWAGEALFVLPWIWLPLVVLFLRGIRVNVAEPEMWFQVCLSAGPILLFALISCWASRLALFHWAAPGYLMLFPSLGAWISRRPDRGFHSVKNGILATACLLLLSATVVGTEVRWNWVPEKWERMIFHSDPDLEAVNWTSFPKELAVRSLLQKPRLVVAGTNWRDCGKLDYALGGRMQVICLTNDPHQYGLSSPPAGADGLDVLVVVPFRKDGQLPSEISDHFRNVAALPPVTILQAGQAVLQLGLFVGSDFRAQPYH